MRSICLSVFDGRACAAYKLWKKLENIFFYILPGHKTTELAGRANSDIILSLVPSAFGSCGIKIPCWVLRKNYCQVENYVIENCFPTMVRCECVREERFNFKQRKPFIPFFPSQKIHVCDEASSSASENKCNSLCFNPGSIAFIRFHTRGQEKKSLSNINCCFQASSVHHPQTILILIPNGNNRGRANFSVIQID